MSNNFYIYSLYAPGRPKGTLFYIGKGNGRRAWDHYKPSYLKKNTHKNNVINNQRTYPMIGHGGLTEHFAHELEKCLIQLYKHQLTNKTDGGEGISGHKHSKKARAKMSEAQNRKPFLIKTEDGTVALRAESTCCKVAQNFLGKSSSHISQLLNSKTRSLFIKIDGNIYYLEYVNQK